MNRNGFTRGLTAVQHTRYYFEHFTTCVQQSSSKDQDHLDLIDLESVMGSPKIEQIDSQDIIDVIDCINVEKTENQTLKEEKSEVTPIQLIKLDNENSRVNKTAGKLSIVSRGSMQALKN